LTRGGALKGKRKSISLKKKTKKPNRGGKGLGRMSQRIKSREKKKNLHQESEKKGMFSSLGGGEIRKNVLRAG